MGGGGEGGAGGRGGTRNPPQGSGLRGGVNSCLTPPQKSLLLKLFSDCSHLFHLLAEDVVSGNRHISYFGRYPQHFLSVNALNSYLKKKTQQADVPILMSLIISTAVVVVEYSAAPFSRSYIMADSQCENRSLLVVNRYWHTKRAADSNPRQIPASFMRLLRDSVLVSARRLEMSICAPWHMLLQAG